MASEANRFSGRVRRYGQVGTNLGYAAVRVASSKLLNGDGRSVNAVILAKSLGKIKGPLMKIAQMVSTIPDLVPGEYASELAKLQNSAPPMGWPFVRRRMEAELGADWQSKFMEFGREPAAAASLGQVHRARSAEGCALACKLQYPDMESVVEADINQLKIIFAVYRRMNPVVLTDEIAIELSERLREELDYFREACSLVLYQKILADFGEIHIPRTVPSLSSGRLLTMSWEEGRPLLDFRNAALETRNLIGSALFRAWWHPFASIGVIHGDPHLGNYSIREKDGVVSGINLLDFGCIRIFSPHFVRGVVDLYQGLRDGRKAQVVHAYETWGFVDLGSEIIDVLNIWARFIYGPLIDDRVRSIADGIKPGEYGRREAFAIHEALRKKGPIKVPREFVFMDRAAIGLGAVFLHLRAEMNFHILFERAVHGFDVEELAKSQTRELELAGIAVPDDNVVRTL